MILTKELDIKWAPSSKKYYEEKGYKFTKLGDTFTVKVEDLSRSSHYKVKIQCDQCGQIKEIQYRYYLENLSLNNNEKFLCRSCVAKKENVLKEKLKKSKETNLKKYRVENPAGLDWVQEKSKKTCLEKYGVEYVTQTDFQKKKSKETLLQRYGVDTPLENKEFLEKSQNTCLQKYGTKNPMQSKEIREKAEATNQKKYGCRMVLQNSEIHQKAIETTKKHYGVEYSLSAPEVREKGKQTSLQKYGVENPAQSPEIQKKIRRAFFKNGSTRTSKQQKEIFDILKEEYGEEVSLNFPCGIYSLDCFLNLSNCKIDIEYDGWYWHQFIKNHDKSRDDFVNKQGIKIIRIKAGRIIPAKEELLFLINKVINEDLFYYEKIYPEWEQNIKKEEKDC